ncbi:MAG: cyclic nucleotide-binding domain protein [Chlamydiia bacterium]|nr:cyclic nucleotide-binding domain protein [Chlamydiia bacterium]
MTPYTIIEKAFFLKKTQLFQELDLDLLLVIADKAELRSCIHGEHLFSINQDAHRIYVILQGIVIITNDEEQEQARLLAGDFFGDESLFNQEPRGYTAQAEGLEETIVLTISRTHLIEIILECPQVAIAIIRSYAAVTPFRKRKLT